MFKSSRTPVLGDSFGLILLWYCYVNHKFPEFTGGKRSRGGGKGPTVGRIDYLVRRIALRRTSPKVLGGRTSPATYSSRDSLLVALGGDGLRVRRPATAP
jgi:hypothetical protein